MEPADIFSFRRRQETYETHLCVCLCVYENYYENLTLCFFATIYELSSENDNVWEKPDT